MLKGRAYWNIYQLISGAVQIPDWTTIQSSTNFWSCPSKFRCWALRCFVFTVSHQVVRLYLTLIIMSFQNRYPFMPGINNKHLPQIKIYPHFGCNIVLDLINTKIETRNILRKFSISLYPENRINHFDWITFTIGLDKTFSLCYFFGGWKIFEKKKR